MNREQIGDGVLGSGKLQIGSVDHFGDEGSAPRNLNRLCTMMCFLSARDALGTRFGAAEILGPRKFVTAVVDDVMRRNPGSDIRPQFRNLGGNDDSGKDQKGLHYIGGDHDPQGNQAKGSFSRQAGFGASEGRADRLEEVSPPRRPLDQQPGRIGAFDRLIELKSLNHQGSGRSLERVITIVSPTSVFVVATV
jgi:hypothetical protein